MPEQIDFPRYLAAKHSVEDRALNGEVWKAMSATLKAAPGQRIVELGAGTGRMAHRLLEAGLLEGAAYTLLDADSELLTRAEEGLQTDSAGFSFEHASALDWAAGQKAQWDFVIAHAFLDLVDLNNALPLLLGLLKEGGHFYFPINYDGLTSFLPTADKDFEEKVFELYHRSMDERQVEGKPAGDRHTGRRLFSALPAVGGHIRAAGASDWVVHPIDGVYPQDEAYFLECMLLFIENELNEHPELDDLQFESWLARRRQQIANGRLAFFAHQFDFFGRFQAVE